MNKLRWCLALVALILAIAPISALAAPLPPEADAWVQSANPNLASNTTQTNWENLWARSGMAACDADRISLFRWNLTGLTTGQLVGGAVLKVRANFVSGSTNEGVVAKLALFKVADDTWDQDITWNSMVNQGIFNPTPPIPTTDLLEEVPLPGPFTTGTTYMFTFQSDALKRYIQEALDNAADKKVSFALLVRGACGIGSVSIRLDSSHLGAPPAATNAAASPLAGTAPSLELAAPSAVALTTLDANQPMPNWPLYIGLAALAALLVGVSVVYRRRAAAR